MVKTLIEKIKTIEGQQRKKLETFVAVAALCTVIVLFPQ